MADTPWDSIIVGQGVAGTTLAWHLKEAGQRVLIVDAQEAVTCSKIAAGLITPITGLRLTLSERYDEFLGTARQFYKKIEKRTGQEFFFDRTAVRLFSSDDERMKWRERRRAQTFQRHLVTPQPTVLPVPQLVDVAGGGFAMHAAQLDMAAYLDASRSVLDWEPMTVDWHHDVVFGPDSISVQGRQTRTVISCEGYGAKNNPYFSWVPFNPAKGDILTVRFHRPLPSQSLHRGIWAAPTRKADIFRIGSTYEWNSLDQVPSPSARQEIEQKLRDFIDIPYTVIDHQAAVRPIIKESNAVIGRHPQHERLGYFNGLGSKGSLHAPWLAQKFTDFLLHETPLLEAVDLQKNFCP